MQTVRGLAVTALAAVTVTVLAVFGILAIPAQTLSAAAATPSWQTTATFRPLTNVNSVSCAPDATASSTTCVAVGDDGGNVASIIVTENGGAPGLTIDSPIGRDHHCPLSRVLRRLSVTPAGTSGIMKSSDGGATWTVQDPSFPAQSISCFTIDECTAVGGIRIVQTTDGDPPGMLRHHRRDSTLLYASRVRTHSPALPSGSWIDIRHDRRGEQGRVLGVSLGPSYHRCWHFLIHSGMLNSTTCRRSRRSLWRRCNLHYD